MVYRCGKCGKRYTRDFQECPSCGGWMYIEDGDKAVNSKSQQKKQSLSMLGIIVRGLLLAFILRAGYTVFLIGQGEAQHVVNQVQQELVHEYDANVNNLTVTEDNTIRNDVKTNKWLQEFNNGDIQVKQAFLCPKYSEEAGKNLWEYTILVEAKCKVKTDMYIHVFDDYKDYLNGQSINQKIDGSGWYTLTGTIYGTETWWYPDIYYFALSDSEHFYDPDLLHMISYDYNHPSARN